MNHYSGISTELEKYLQDSKSPKYGHEVIGHGLRSLPALRDFLREDLPIDAAERLEALLKVILRRAMAGPVSGRDANVFQQPLPYVRRAIACRHQPDDVPFVVGRAWPSLDEAKHLPAFFQHVRMGRTRRQQ